MIGRALVTALCILSASAAVADEICVPERVLIDAQLAKIAEALSAPAQVPDTAQQKDLLFQAAMLKFAARRFHFAREARDCERIDRFYPVMNGYD